MRNCIKTCVAITILTLCATTMAETIFIVKYKNELQPAKELSAEKIRDLQEKAQKAGNKINKIKELHLWPTGAHVIALDSDLNAAQTQDFINNVQKNSDVAYIEPNQSTTAVTTSQK